MLQRISAVGLLVFLASVSHASEQTTTEPIQPVSPALVSGDGTPTPFSDIATPANISLDKLNRTIIGTWTCQDTIRLADGITSYQATLRYKTDGTLISHKVSHGTYADVTGSYTVHTKKRWRILPSDNDTLWVMTEQIDDTTHFSMDNDALESKTNLRAFLASKPTHELLITLQNQGKTATLSLIDPLSGYRIAYCQKTGG